jgi:LuxR family transcriptional activator of conjugal transfer of Ti plasmids
MIDCQRTEEMLGYLAESSSEVDLNRQLVKICENFFIDKFAIARFFDSGYQSRSIECFDTYPREWMDHYIKNQYYVHDKVVELKRIRLPFSWKIDSLLEELTPPQQHLYREASDFGICKGMVIPLLPNNSEQSLLAILDVVYPHPDMVHTLSLACQLYWGVKRKLDAKQTLNLFTVREKEVLFLKSQGLPIKVVADRLAISESTVIFHIKNARHKLKATSIDHTLYLFGRAVEQAQLNGSKKLQLSSKNTGSDKEISFGLNQLLVA